MVDYIKIILKRFPYLKINLIQAGMNIKAEEFIKKRLIDSLIISLTISITLFFFLLKVKSNLLWALFASPIIYLSMFLFLINTPRVVAARKIREIDREITYAGRFLIIELNAGIPLFDAVKNISEHFEYIGKYFKEIVKKVDIGMGLEDALNETMETTPSDNFRKLLFTIVNSLKTGADVAESLKNIIEQIGREKLIKLKEYGKKLNPIVMFYLIIAVIAPSLGIAIMTLLSSFLGITLSLITLLIISFFISILQLVFMSVLDNLRKGI